MKVSDKKGPESKSLCYIDINVVSKAKVCTTMDLSGTALLLQVILPLRDWLRLEFDAEAA